MPKIISFNLSTAAIMQEIYAISALRSMKNNVNTPPILTRDQQGALRKLIKDAFAFIVMKFISHVEGCNLNNENENGVVDDSDSEDMILSVDVRLCDDITNAVIDEEIITSARKYHTITEAKNGAGATPIKTEKGWIHIAHGVRNTAAGLRYVIYAFATDLKDPSKVIAEPGGLLIGPRGWERVGDVSNVVFTNGAITCANGDVYIYYAASDTRLHVAKTSVEKLIDFVFNTPEDALRSVKCVEQRCEMIKKNLEILKNEK